MAELPSDRPIVFRAAAPEVRDRLARLLTAELMMAWDRAVSQGAPPVDLATTVHRRCRAIREMLPVAQTVIDILTPMH